MTAPTEFTQLDGFHARMDCLDAEAGETPLKGRGAANAQVSKALFDGIARQGIHTHLEGFEPPTTLHVKGFDHDPPRLFVQYVNYEHGTRLEKPHLYWHSALVHHPLAHQAKDYAL